MKLTDGILGTLADQGHHIPHILVGELFAAVDEVQKTVDGLDRRHHTRLLATDLNLRVTDDHLDVVLLLQQANIAIVTTEKGNGLFHPFHLNNLFCHKKRTSSHLLKDSTII